ncbi:LysR family transcriptional regulator [Vibrio sp.]|nr:LysR family transcriptional regulator [Vibrio sp.]
MDRIEAMKRFLAVAHSGSFTLAADVLGVPKSAISTSVSKLENHLKVRLLHRSTRNVTLTEAGQEYQPRCEKFLSELDEFEHHFQQQTDELRGTIYVDMPGSFYTKVVLPEIENWFAMHPKTHVKLLGADYRINPIKERVDFVVRVGELEDSTLIARRIGTMEIINCVSAEYRDRFGVPKSLEDLKNHYLIGYSTGTNHQANGFEYVLNEKIHHFQMPYRVTVSTTEAYTASCLRGLGIIQVPKVGMETYLESGTLIEVLNDYRCAPMPVSVVYESRQYMPKKVSTFINWLETVFKKFNHTPI